MATTGRTWRITVPYTYQVSGVFEHEIDEDDVLEYFEVESLDQISPQELDQYLRETADDAVYDIADEEICALVREQKGLETEPDGIQIEVEEQDLVS